MARKRKISLVCFVIGGLCEGMGIGMLMFSKQPWGFAAVALGALFQGVAWALSCSADQDAGRAALAEQGGGTDG